MGYGPIINGKQHPITKWGGSWAAEEAARRAAPKLFHGAQCSLVVFPHRFHNACSCGGPRPLPAHLKDC
jgi:hypothetical protein